MAADAVVLPARRKGDWTAIRQVVRPLRAGLSRMMGEAESLAAAARLARIARAGRPVIVGPWLGEVGFELLYWVPFVAWTVSRFGIDRARVVAVSRGGAGSWYRHLSDRYCDVYDFLTPEEFRERNERRRTTVGEQKQTAIAELDAVILAAVRRKLGDEDCEVIHPSAMYRLFKRYWWGHISRRWIDRHAEFHQFARPVRPVQSALPSDYAAVKFYFNDCFPPTLPNRTYVAEILRALSQQMPVVSLNTGLALDDHRGCDDGRDPAVTSIRHLVRPRNNLDVQSAIVGNARVFVGTYGGFSYLAPFHGVPSVAMYSDASGFSRSHLEVACSTFKAFGRGSLRTFDVGQTDTASVVSAIHALAC